MSSITALLHTHNDAMRLGRCLETLYPCDEIVIIDHDSTDATVSLAGEYGARVVAASAMWGLLPSAVQRSEAPRQHRQSLILEVLSAESVKPSWILCLHPNESVSESLAASLFELRSLPHDSPALQAFSVFLREEAAEGWVRYPAAETRLVPPIWPHWDGNIPQHSPSASVLEGELLRFVFP